MLDFHLVMSVVGHMVVSKVSFEGYFSESVGFLLECLLHFLPHVIQRCYWGDDSGRCVTLPSPRHSTVLLG